MEDAPLNIASLLRLSVFHADVKCASRSWKRFLSILISAMVLEVVDDDRDSLWGEGRS